VLLEATQLEDEGLKLHFANIYRFKLFVFDCTPGRLSSSPSVRERIEVRVSSMVNI
jgi:hypothetical protein